VIFFRRAKPMNKIRRTALICGLIALAFYAGFIVFSVVRGSA
jgi:hypothetical protein